MSRASSSRLGVALTAVVVMLGIAVVTPRAGAAPLAPTSTVMSGGSGGYVPVTPLRVLDTAAGVGRKAGSPLGTGEVLDVRVAGAAPVPDEGVGAVVLSVTAAARGADSAVVVWPSGAARPDVAAVSARRRGAESLVIVPVGAGGAVSVATRAGRADVSLDVVGWFPDGDGMVPIAPDRILDTRTGVGAPAAKGGTAGAIDVDVVHRAGYPEAGAEAAVLGLTASRASTRSSVTVWPAGTRRPGTVNLIAEPGHDSTAMVIADIGANGSVTIGADRGRADFSADLLGWLRADGTYHAIAGQRLLGVSPKGHAAKGRFPKGHATKRLRRDGMAELQVGSDPGDPAAPAGDVADPARVAVLSVTAVDRRPAGVTVWPADEDRPEHPSLLAPGGGAPRAGLVLAELSADGRVAIRSSSRSTRLNVDLVGWFTAPTTAAELEVPADVNMPDAASVTSATGSSAAGAVVTLGPDAAAVQVGEPLIVGATPDAPEGLMGRVTGVAAVTGGGQRVTTEPMALPEIFPQGDIQVDVGAQELTPADISVQPTAEGARLTDAASGLEIGLNLTPDSSNECAVADGGFGFDFSPLFRARYSFKWTTQYRLGFIPVGIKPNVTLLATLGGDASLWLQKLEVTCGFDVKIGKVLVPIPDTPIYVVFDFSGGLDLSAAIDPRVEAKAHTEVTIGIRNNSLYRDASATVQLPSLSDLLGSGNLNAYAMADVWLKASAKIQGIVGPRIQVGPFAEATLTDDPARPWFALDMGLAGQVALDIDLGSFGTLTPVSWTGEIPIASGLGACTLPFGPGFSGAPCRIPAPRTRPDGSTRFFQPRIRLTSSGAPLFGQAGRYAVVAGDYTWSEAEAAARLSVPPRCTSAHLATITSREEQDVVSSAFGSSLIGKWLGARQDGALGRPSADWHWVTGEPWSYTNWQSGEPNDDLGVDENALGFGGSTAEPGSWNDFTDGSRQGYVVEAEGCRAR